MNIDLREVLVERADRELAPGGAGLDPDEVLDRGRQLLRRRRRQLLAAVSAAVVTVAGLSIGVVRDRGAPEPVGPVEHPRTWAPGTRPLTWAEARLLHLGSTTVALPFDPLSIDVTDDGAVVTDIDGGIWFTDGDAPQRLGTTLGLRHVGPRGFSWWTARPHDWVVTDSAGSLTAWIEYVGGRRDRPQLVVLDTRAPGVVARVPVDVSDRSTAVASAVAGRGVFVTEDWPGGIGGTWRYDLDSRVLERVEETEVTDAVRAVPRAVVVGDTDGLVLGSPTPDLSVPRVREILTSRDAVLEPLVDPVSGRTWDVRLPAESEIAQVWFSQWLDDDRFSVVTDAGAGELLECSLAGGRCVVAVDGSFSFSHPVTTPGDGLRGAEHSLGRALQARE